MTRTTILHTVLLLSFCACGGAHHERASMHASRDAGIADAASDDDASSGASIPCDSTWHAIQTSIFANKSCNASTCHSGGTPAGGLDLTPDHAYQNLIYQPAQASLPTPMYRIQPGEQALSFLYLKVDAAAGGAALPASGGSPMPVGKTPLNADQLSALKLWIRAGAPESGIVAGTQDLLDCSLPADADPNRAPRPPVPAVDEGFQQVAGPWTVDPNSENEVCFATYYDLSAVAPDWAQLPCDPFNDGTDTTCVGYKRRQLSQDAQSHHSIIQIYMGKAGPNDPSFGRWRCAGGGQFDGMSCDPMKQGVSAADGGADCGDPAVCQSEPTKSTACRGYGPSDRDTRSIGAGGAQSPVSTDDFPQGVYARIPLKGIVVWNSHGFNLTKESTEIAQYNTFWYAHPDERSYLVHGIFDTRNIFVMNVPPFQSREYCANFTLPQYSRLIELSSHTHKRGIRWRTWLPPQSTDCTPANGCMPDSSPAVYESESYNDPVVMSLSPALDFEDSDASTRTLKYCAVYDNGKSDPRLVKRKSMLPAGANPCADSDTYCFGGDDNGQPCGGDDSKCSGGVCDACTVTGGVTTEDEMFILLGDYYVMPPSP